MNHLLVQCVEVISTKVPIDAYIIDMTSAVQSCCTVWTTKLFLQNGWTALHVAASEGSAEMVAYMMEQVSPNVDARNVRTTVHLVYMYML